MNFKGMMKIYKELSNILINFDVHSHKRVMSVSIIQSLTFCYWFSVSKDIYTTERAYHNDMCVLKFLT